jgi:hypothetical protein
MSATKKLIEMSDDDLGQLVETTRGSDSVELKADGP